MSRVSKKVCRVRKKDSTDSQIFSDVRQKDYDESAGDSEVPPFLLKREEN